MNQELVSQYGGVDLKTLAKLDAHTMPRNRDELFGFCKTYFGWHFARRAVTEGHMAPLDVLAALFFEDLLDVILLASRTSGKTLMLGTLNLMNSVFKDGCETCALGAVLYQTEKMFSYVRTMFETEVFKDDLGPSVMKMTRLKNGSTLQVLTGTVTGTNAPHPHKAIADEVELIDWAILQQFFSMARSEKQIAGQNILSSTRKVLYGSMQRLLDKVAYEPSFPFKVLTWDTFDVLERCDGSQCNRCREIIRPEDEKSFYATCMCRAKEADGFYLLQDAQRKFVTLDANVWDSEWENKKPARSGLVYKEMPEERFLPLYYDPSKRTFAGVDDGFVHPFCFLLMQSDTSDNVYVIKELFGSQVEHSTWIGQVSDLFLAYGLRKAEVVLHVDVRASALIAELRKAGFTVRGRSLPIVDSIRHVKKWVIGKTHPKLLIDGDECPNLRREMGLYRYHQKSELPKDEDNDAVDALRYGMCGRYPRIGTVESTAELPATGGDRRQHKSVEELREEYIGMG